MIAAPSLVILPREGESPPHGGRQYGHFLALEVLQPAKIAPMKSSLAYEMSAFLGGGKRPTCEVLIRVRLRRMFPSSLVSAFDPGHDHTTDIAIEPVAAPTP